MSRGEDPIQAVIDAAQRFDSPSAAVKARTWAAVQSRWAAGDEGPALEVDPSPAAATTATGVSKGWLVIATMVVAGAVGLGAAWSAGGGSSDPAPAVASVEESIPALDEPELQLPPDTSEATRSVEVEGPSRPVTATVEGRRDAAPRARAQSPTRSPRARAAALAPPPAPPEEAAPKSGLGLEVALVGEARQALGRGDATRALERLEEHRKRFVQGRLVQERELLRVNALCELGRKSAARTAAMKLLERNPSEALRRTLVRHCVGELALSP